MTTPEQLLVRKRLRLLDEEAEVQSTLELLEHENAWVKSFIARLAKAIRSIGK
jgi:hypothetical protein